jgi:DNA-binding transcriptional LysR family regulator
MMRCNATMNAAHEASGAASGSPEQLARVDLNLLVAFDALARELSVTRAAQRVGVTQSAMSHSLRRLRELMNDPLLVRGQSGMRLTPRAEALEVPLRSGLVTLGRALEQLSAFTPATARRSFCIASPDLFDVLVVPPLLERVRALAPGIDISIVPTNTPQLALRLETGDIDFAVVPRVDQSRNAPPQPSPQGLVQKTLFRDRYACLLRADHAVLAKKRSLSLEQYVRLSHVLVAPRGDGLGQVDEALAERAMSRRIVLRMPHFFAALAIVARSDLVLTAPTVLAALGDPHLPVVSIPPPLPLPEHSVNLLWHERFTNDAAHLWLRELLGEVAREADRKLDRARRGKRKK